MATDNLKNPTKTRAKGPAGRKLPSRKTKTEEEDEREASPAPVCVPERTVELDCLGKMNSEEFDRVWFIKVPSMSSLLSTESSSESCKAEEEEIQNNNNIVYNSKSEGETLDKSPLEIEKKDLEEDSCEGTEDEKTKGKKRWKNCVIL